MGSKKVAVALMSMLRSFRLSQSWLGKGNRRGEIIQDAEGEGRRKVVDLLPSQTPNRSSPIVLIKHAFTS